METLELHKSEVGQGAVLTSRLLRAKLDHRRLARRFRTVSKNCSTANLEEEAGRRTSELLQGSEGSVVVCRLGLVWVFMGVFAHWFCSDILCMSGASKGPRATRTRAQTWPATDTQCLFRSAYLQREGLDSCTP